MAKQAVLVLGFAVVFGIFVPWYRGFDFLDPVMLTAYLFLALLFVAPASAEGFASGEGAPTVSAILVKAALILAYGWGIAVLVLTAGIVTVNLSHWHGYVLAPSALMLLSVLLLSLTASLVMMAVCALLVRKFSASTVKGFVRLAYLIVLSMLAFGYRFLPQNARSMLAEQTTTASITQVSFISSAFLACVGCVLMGVVVRRSRARA